MFFKVAAAAGKVLWGEVEGFGFVVRLLTLNYAIEDADEFVRGGDEAFGFAGPSLCSVRGLGSLGSLGRKGWACGETGAG